MKKNKIYILKSCRIINFLNYSGNCSFIVKFVKGLRWYIFTLYQHKLYFMREANEGEYLCMNGVENILYYIPRYSIYRVITPKVLYKCIIIYRENAIEVSML